MPRYDADAIWGFVPNGKFETYDEDEQDFCGPSGDYELLGSAPLTPYEAMCFAVAGASHCDDSLIAYPEF